MLLDEVFNDVKQIKKVWVRRGDKLAKLSRDVAAPKDLPKLTHPMFPIKKPRYADEPKFTVDTGALNHEEDENSSTDRSAGIDGIGRDYD